MFLDRSRSTSCKAGHDGAASSGASKSFSTHAENRFSVARFHVLRRGQTVPAVAPGRGGSSPRTAISRVQSLPASVARHVPAAGDCTSTNQKYGGPPYRWRDFAATLPSGAISESSPWTACSAAKTTRKGAPFHGATGDDRTARSPSSQAPLAWVGAGEKARSAPAISRGA